MSPGALQPERACADSSALSISCLVPPPYLASLGDSFWPSTTVAPQKFPLTPSLGAATNADPFEHMSARTCYRLTTPSSGDLWDIMLPSGQGDNLNAQAPAPPMRSPGRAVGNFMLSSCPGKKVRMEAVTQAQAIKLAATGGGRSAICRDVVMDLGRAKDEGVGVVICCLDDQGEYRQPLSEQRHCH